MKEQTVKIGLIVVGVTAVALGGLWLAYILTAGPVAPTAAGGDSTGIVAIIMQIAGVVTMLVGMLADFKKAIPPEVVAAVKRMIAGGKLDVGELVKIASGYYGKVDMAAIMELIKQLKDGFPHADDSVIVTPTPPPPTPPAPTPRPLPIVATDDELLREMLLLATRVEKRPVRFDVTVGDRPVLTLDVKQPAPQPDVTPNPPVSQLVL